MDAFTQLLESYLSPNASPVTDALAYEGLKQVAKALPEVYLRGDNLEARAGMSLAAYLSGITLANAGLGLVHGFASSVGGYFEIPHGVICSRLMPAANRLTVRRLRKEVPDDVALIKYAEIGRLFSGEGNKSKEYYTDALVAQMEDWVNEMAIPTLSSFSVRNNDYKRIVAATDNKNNPVKLDPDEMLEVLAMAG
jgi:alcohol dehydrogenase class IV